MKAPKPKQKATRVETVKRGKKIVHLGFPLYDVRQKMVQYAYDVGGLDEVIKIECENGNWNPQAVGDNGHAHGLCQMNDLFHAIPQQYFQDWKFQIDYCNQKRLGGTAFYGPDRIIKSTNQKCSTYVQKRFEIK